MTDKSGVYSAVRQRIDDAGRVAEVVDLLQELDRLRQSGELSDKDTYGLQVPAFHALRRLTLESPVDAEDLVLRYLLPLCLARSSDAGVILHRLRECLVEWLNQYPGEDVRGQLRDAVLERVYPRLGSTDPTPACWLISQIGYRTDRAVDLLWDLAAESDDETGDTALTALVDLGIQTGDRERVLRELHRRASARCNPSLRSALATMADPTSIAVVSNRWLRSSDLALRDLDRSLVFNVLRAVLDSESDDSAVQDSTWQMLVDLVGERPDEFFPEFSLGHTAPVCNSTLVVPTMLEWLGEQYEDDGKASRARYLIGLRLQECTRPRQLEGWRHIRNAQALELLRADACLDTGTDGFWTTMEARSKKIAWETLLRAGFARALEWFDEAVLSETSRFTQQSLIEWFSLFRFESLPQAILGWITEDAVHAREEKDSREFMRRMAATRMARSSASREAFDALLRFGFTSDGKAMMPSVLAVAEVAGFLLANGDSAVIEDLVHTAAHGEKQHQRVAAAYAIEHIASSSPLLLMPHTDELVSIAFDTERDAVERGTILNALSYLEKWKIPGRLLHQMKTWARQSERWVGGGSLHALARRGHLHDDPQLLCAVLGLRQVAGKWDVAPDCERFEWVPYTIGLLYYEDPEVFAPAVASLLRDLEWARVAQILGWLDHTHGAPGQPEPAEAIKDALLRRARERQRSISAETETIRLLGKLAPEELVRETWSDEWQQWLADSRVALADALGEARLAFDSEARALVDLTLLARDSQYAVRRAAYRGISRRSVDALRDLCALWSGASSVELRWRAAEACGWIDDEAHPNNATTFQELYRRLAADRDKVVRSAAERARQERRKRLWARHYVSIVTRVEGRSNQEILDAWRYGEALARTGDDSCTVALREHLNRKWNSLPPNARYWFQQIIKGLEENWRKATREWPDPWFAWKGTVHEGAGSIHTRGEKSIEIKYSIWSQPRAAPSEPLVMDWGGAVWPIPFPLLGPHDVIIEVEGNRRGRILITRTSGDTAIFLGSGPCPI
jgi:hypothetical protein